MEKKLKIRINSYESFLYLILVPFLYPRGFQEYFSAYKIFFTSWLYIAIVLVLMMFIYSIARQKVSYKKCVWFMLLYFLVFIVITFAVQGGIKEGLQKLFMAPTFCLLCAMCLQHHSEKFIRCVGNILNFNFMLNITVFNPLLWNQFFYSDSNIIFLGHIQVAAQLGVLGVLISYVLYKIDEKKKSRLLLILSLVTMIMSGTSASYMAVVFIIIFYLLSKRLKFVKNILFRPGIAILTFLVVNLLIWYSLSYFTSEIVDVSMTTITSGRTFIWRQVFKLMEGHWLIGYGAYGVLIKVFWSQWTINPKGMNYAHNELLQRLLDGGIILLLLFLLMLYMYVKNINKTPNLRLNYWSYVVLVIMMMIMIFESVTEYYYFFALLSMLAYLPEIEKMIERKNRRYGTYIKN